MMQIESPTQDADPLPPRYIEVALFMRQEHCNNPNNFDLCTFRPDLIGVTQALGVADEGQTNAWLD